jgi:hypothetical protein
MTDQQPPHWAPPPPPPQPAPPPPPPGFAPPPPPPTPPPPPPPPPPQPAWAPAAPPPPPQQWSAPAGYVPPPPPAGYVAGGDLISEPANPARKVIFSVLGLGLILGGVVVGVFLSVKAFTGANDDVNDMPRGPLPVAELELTADARETIHIENPTIGDGDSDNPSRAAEEMKSQALAADITVTGPDGQDIPVEGVSGSSVYSFGRSGIAVGRIEVPEDGTYLISVQGFPHDGDVAVGDVSFTGLFKDFGMGLGIFIVGLIVGIPLYRLRRKRS